jgi:hypothetical protein
LLRPQPPACHITTAAFGTKDVLCNSAEQPPRMLAPLLVSAAATAVVVAGASQTPLGSTSAHRDRILTDELRQEISNILAKHGVVGHALAVVRPGTSEPVEFANWGNATEGGRSMSSNVSDSECVRLERVADASVLSSPL